MQPAERLARWVKQKHKGQVKKYTGEPYFYHLRVVAELARGAAILGYEIGICHDLLEDTHTSAVELTKTLVNFSYSQKEAGYITACVVELTDVFTAKAYPNLSREVRKERESLRLGTISPVAQTVKYCDLIDNMQLVIKYAPEHAEPYLQKKKLLLDAMTNGNKLLWHRAMDIINAYKSHNCFLWDKITVGCIRLFSTVFNFVKKITTIK